MVPSLSQKQPFSKISACKREHDEISFSDTKPYARTLRRSLQVTFLFFIRGGVSSLPPSSSRKIIPFIFSASLYLSPNTSATGTATLQRESVKRRREARPRREKEEGERVAERGEVEDPGFFLGKLAPIAMVTREQKGPRPVCAFFLVSFLEACKIPTDAVGGF